MINQDVSTFYAAYRKSDEGHYVEVNHDLLKAAGAATINDVVGLKDADLPWYQMASYYIENDQMVIKTEQTHVFYEPCLFAGKPQLYRATKAPLMGNSGKVIGIHGVSVLVSDRCLIPLTHQQTACLTHLARGYTYKQIGLELGLSQKTVEHYLEAVKIKLDCNSRAELIMQAIERGLVGVF
jgi:DNA-binding CsgD family transcriptional regulator